MSGPPARDRQDRQALKVNAGTRGPFVGEMYTLVPAVARRIHEAIMTFPDTLLNLTVPCPRCSSRAEVVSTFHMVSTALSASPSHLAGFLSVDLSLEEFET